MQKIIKCESLVNKKALVNTVTFAKKEINQQTKLEKSLQILLKNTLYEDFSAKTLQTRFYDLTCFI